MDIDISKYKIIPNDEKNIYEIFDISGNKLIVPESVAIILDGNGRYAKKNNLPISLGHKKGCETLEIILEEAVKFDIKYLTVFAFSTENWKRSKEEINSLFDLFFSYLKKIEEKAIKNNVKISFIGDIYKFPENLYKECERLIDITKNNNKSIFTIAFNYGGRDEIIRTVKKLNKNNFNFEELNEDIFSKNLDTYNIKDPDLLIRTSGEYRISNFLLWQIAYSELYITDVLWPEFNLDEFHKAIISYNFRNRRFGGR